MEDVSRVDVGVLTFSAELPAALHPGTPICDHKSLYANAVGPYKCGVFTRAEVGASENRSHTAAERPTRGADILHILRHATHPRASSCLTRLACSLILLLLERVEQRRGCPVGHGTSHHADDPDSAEAEENVHGWAVE